MQTLTAKPWLSQYPDYIKPEIPPHQFKDLVQMFENSVKKYPDLPAYENMDKSLSYLEVDKLSNDFAAFLQNDCKLKPGDRFVIQTPNVLQFPVAMLAAMKAGLVLVNTNPLYTPREMEHQFRDSGAVAIVILANFAHNLEKIIGNTTIKTVIVTEIGDLFGGLKKVITNFVVKKVKKMVPPYHLPGAISFNNALEKGSKSQHKRYPWRSDETAFLQYTGGTTGLSKGAELTHSNVMSNIAQINPFISVTRKGPLSAGDIAIVPLPMYHIFALTASFLFMSIGMKCLLVTNPRDFTGFIKLLRKPFHSFIGVNTLFNALLNHPNFGDIDFSQIKSCTAGGMALHEAVFQRWQEKSGVTISEGYGLSETSPALTYQITGKERMGCIGVPVPSTEIKMMDDNGNEVPPGESGELCARGPQVFKGYWQKDNTSVFHPGGWFKTGDIATMDPEGFIRIVDRKKDMILVSGFNVYPNEVEGVVAGHPKVLEVAAIGVADPQCGEVVKLVIVKRDESLTEEEVNAFCKQNLTGYKRPKFIEFRKEIPKTNVGKILRRALRE